MRRSFSNTCRRLSLFGCQKRFLVTKSNLLIKNNTTSLLYKPKTLYFYTPTYSINTKYYSQQTSPSESSDTRDVQALIQTHANAASVPVLDAAVILRNAESLNDSAYETAISIANRASDGDINTWTNLIGLLAENGEADAVLHLLDVMLSENVQATHVTFYAIVNGLVSRAPQVEDTVDVPADPERQEIAIAIEAVRRVLVKMKTHGILPDLFCFQSLFNLNWRARSLLKMKEILHTVVSCNIVPAPEMFHTAITALAKVGELTRMEDLLALWDESGLPNDPKLYIDLFKIFSENGDKNSMVRVGFVIKNGFGSQLTDEVKQMVESGFASRNMSFKRHLGEWLPQEPQADANVAGTPPAK
eukprot:TRINITY_DN1938_c0_g1_i1.p1 TRINITY_DN1938_c0_g1~~TRINITY_DN1938_c0_g1_i1.p1  ORF type:complete len:360 (+),score=62.46 TRINITY_DN1938_c0_g1_i1:60-1139(+)